MKRTIALLAILALLIPAPIYAYSPPGQGSDNATDIIIWHGDNLTIESANLTGTITVDSLEDAMVAATEAHADKIAEDYLPLLIVALLIALVFWQRTIFLYAVGGPTAIVYGLSLATTDAELSLWVAGVVIAMIGTSFIYQAALMGFGWLKSRRE